MKMELRNALPEDFNFILKLTRRNMEKIVTEEWNARKLVPQLGRFQEL